MCEMSARPSAIYTTLVIVRPPPPPEVLKRLDDTDAEVRHCAAAAVPALVAALGPGYCGQQWRGHVQHFAQTLLVFLDDADERLQQLAYGEDRPVDVK